MVWKLGADGVPAPVRVEIGISDGRQTEIVERRLAEGDTVITGIAGAGSRRRAEQHQQGGGNRGGGGPAPARFL